MRRKSRLPLGLSKKQGLSSAASRLAKTVGKKQELDKFASSIVEAKTKGFTKERFMEGIRGMQLQFQMGWMLEPVTTERSASLARDYDTTVRLLKYVEKNW